MPVVGHVYDHRLNGERGSVKVLDLVADPDDDRHPVWVAFRYVHDRDGRRDVAILPAAQFATQYHARTLEAVRS